MIKVLILTKDDLISSQNTVLPLNVTLSHVKMEIYQQAMESHLVFYVYGNVIKVLKNRAGREGQLMGSIDLGIMLKKIAQKEADD